MVLVVLLVLTTGACGQANAVADWAIGDKPEAGLEPTETADSKSALTTTQPQMDVAEANTTTTAASDRVDRDTNPTSVPSTVAAPATTATTTAAPSTTETATSAAPATTAAPLTTTTTAPATVPPTTSPPAAPSFPAVDLSNITGPEYVIDLDRFNIANDGTAPVATRRNLQAALDWAHEQGYGTVKLPAGQYLIGEVGNDIYFDGIHLQSNTALVLDDNAEIKLATNDKWNSCAVTIGNASNVAVIGGQITGDRLTHIFTPRASDGSVVHDEGHNICVQSGANNVLIEGVHLRQATGDAILLVGNRSQGEVHNITIRNNNLGYNRRQGVSIVGAQQVLIEGNEIHHTNGTAPQFGIDIESLSFDSRDIIIRNNDFHHNRGGDIVNTDGKNVLVEGNRLWQGEGNTYIDGPLVSWPRGDWTVRNNTITMDSGSVNGRSGFIGYSGAVDDREAATSYFLNNTCNNCGMYVYNSENIVVRGNTFNQGHIAMQYFNNAIIENNAVVDSARCWAYRFKQVTGAASGNTYNGEPFDIALSDVPWDGCWIN